MGKFTCTKIVSVSLHSCQCTDVIVYNYVIVYTHVCKYCLFMFHDNKCVYALQYFCCFLHDLHVWYLWQFIAKRYLPESVCSLRLSVIKYCHLVCTFSTHLITNLCLMIHRVYVDYRCLKHAFTTSTMYSCYQPIIIWHGDVRVC